MEIVYRQFNIEFKGSTIGSILPSIPVGYAVYMKELYDNIKHDEHQQQICGGLKVIALLGCTSNQATPSFSVFCQAKALHYKRQHWPFRQSLGPGQNNVGTTNANDRVQKDFVATTAYQTGLNEKLC